MRTVFQYSTVAEFRTRLQVTLDEYPDITDAIIRSALQRASNVINQATGEIFLPAKGIVEVDGSGFDLVTHPNMYPFLQVDAITIDYSRSLSSNSDISVSSGTQTVTSGNYGISNSGLIIQLLFSGVASTFSISKFPRGRRNISIDGIFGWLEPRKDYTTVILGVIEEGDTSVVLDDIDSVEVRDILVFGDMDGTNNELLRWVQVISIDYDTKEIAFESVVNRSDLPLQPLTVVTCFGQVPLAIDIATGVLAYNKEIPGLASEVSASNVKHMKTDAFAFTKFTSEELGGAPTQTLTGDNYADQLLQEYLRPPFIGAF